MFIVLYLLWFILNERFTPELALIGLAIVAPLYAFAWKKCGFTPKAELARLRLVPRAAVYMLVLLGEIIKANFSVLGLLFSRREVKPVLVSFTPALRTRTARAVLASSITLTPGTITVSEEDGRFTVHCLDESLSGGLADSAFVRRLAAMEDKNGNA